MELVIPFENVLIANFKKREKRFFAYFEKDGEEIVAHCPNTGKMEGLCNVGSLCILTKKETGKLQYTWQAELVEGEFVGVNTQIPNKIVEYLIGKGFLKEYGPFKKEQKYFHIKPDFLSDKAIVEAKNVHWKIGNTAYFPDCETKRGSKQLEVFLNQNEKEVFLIYVIQRSNVKNFAISRERDKIYYDLFQKTKDKKIKKYFFILFLNSKGIYLNKVVTFLILLIDNLPFSN